MLKARKAKTLSVKLLFASSVVVLLCSVSCNLVHERQAGGGAWDDSEVGQAIDANAPLPGDSVASGTRSYEEWRNSE